MSGVDNRVVHMTFDNAKFERDIAKTLESLAKLKAAMDFSGYKKGLEGLNDNLRLKLTMDSSQVTNSLAEVKGLLEKVQSSASFSPATKGLNDLAEAGKKFHLNGMIGAVSGVSKSFVAMSTVAITALATIVSHAVTSALHMGNAFTFAPIIGGFREMETNMNSIQTILANTRSKGTTLDQVNAALQQLNEYSDRTIYNFGQMAKNIGTFTAAGIDLDTSVGAIKGIANLAAISGSNAEQASSAMYQLSQALSKGRVELIDWISVRNAGMGGEVFKSALFETLKALGKIEEVPMKQTFAEWTKAGGTFEDLLARDVITSDVLTTTLQAFTGDLNQAQLVALGYTEEQAVQMEELGKLGNAAATEVKTLTQLLGTVKEAVGTGWADSFKIIFGDFEEAKSMFTDFNNTLGKFVGINADSRNELLQNWKDLGGRTRLIEGVKNAFDTLRLILFGVKDAFHDIFPAVTAERLFELTDQFAKFFENLRANRGFFIQLNLAFKTFFAVIEIGIELIKRFGEFVVDMFQHFSGGDAGPVIKFFDNLALGIIGLHDALVDGGGIDRFFDKVTDKIINFSDAFKADPSGVIEEVAGNIGSAIGQLFDSLVFGDFHGGFLAEDSPLVTYIFEIRDLIKGGIDRITDVLSGVQDKVNEILDIDLDVHIPQALKDFFNGIDESVDENTTNSLAGGFDVVTDALKRFFDIAEDVWDVMTDIGDALETTWEKFEEFKDTATEALGEVWDFIKEIGPNLQTFFESESFDQIISLVDSLALLLGGRGLQQLGSKGLAIDLGGNLGKSGGLFENLAGTFGAVKTNLDQLTGTLKTMQTQIRANALLKIAQAMALLTGAVLVLSLINTDALTKSLTALAVGMGQLLGAVALLNLSGGKGGLTPGLGLISLTTALIGISTAMVILSGALAILAAIDADKLANGLLALETLIIEMATAAVLFSGKSGGLFVGGTAMIAIATALVILGGALKIFATMSWEEIGKGMTVITGSLLILSAAMSEMSLKAPITAPAMIAVATALVILGAALKIFATMSWEEIGKAGTVLAGALLILSAAMQEMSLKAPITGPALIAIATALVILGGALKIFATMDWEEIGKAMVVLLGSLLILDAAMASMTNAIPGAIAIGIVSVSLLILTKALKGMAKMEWKELGKGLAVMAISLAALAVAALLMEPAVPALLALSVALLALGAGFALFGVGAALLGEALQIIAAAGTAGVDVFMYALDQLVIRLPEMLSILMESILMMGQQLIDALPALIMGTGKIIEALLRVIIDAIPDINKATVAIIEAFFSVIRDSSDDAVRTGFKLIMDFLHGLESNITEITDTAATIIERFLRELTSHLPELVDAGAELTVTFLEEIGKHADEIVTAAFGLVLALADALRDNVDELVDAAFEMLTDFLTEFGEHAVDVADTVGTLIIQFIAGVGKNALLITTAATLVILQFIAGLANNTLLLINAGADIVIDFLHGVAKAIRDHDNELSDAFADLGAAIIEGIIVGLVATAPKLMKKVASLMEDAVSAAVKPWEWNSPSHIMVRLGKGIIEGLILGLDEDSSKLNRTITGVGISASNTFQKSLSTASLAMEQMGEFAPVITPVLDLTGVRATAGEIQGLIPNTTLNTGVSLQAAQTLASETRAREEAEADDSTENQAPRELSFTQNNYSPETLNTAKIHKQTRNLIVLTKEELEIP